MVEGSQIDWGGHGNNAVYVEKEMIDFDKAIGKALDFAKKDGHTLVLITADHETGGMSLVEGNLTARDSRCQIQYNGPYRSNGPCFCLWSGS